MNNLTLRDRFVHYISSLQDIICSGLEELDGKETFQEDLWKRASGGGGATRVLAGGRVFEKAGVNTSVVYGPLDERLQRNLNAPPGWFFATGISLVIHPENPMVPTVHANFRYFELRDSEDAPVRDSWFGGGADLTPYYFWEEDVRHFHRVLKQACDEHDPDYYSRYKKWADEYFYLPHRGHTRGVGGVFFDYLRAGEDRTQEDWYEFVTSVGDVFLDAYLPIAERRWAEPYTEKHRYHQEIYRGRYTEFNLLYDRGTVFGLQSDGRVESILMSLPPRVRWDYAHPIKPGSAEAHMMAQLKAQDWLELEAKPS